MEQLGDGTFSKTGNIHEFDDVKNNLMLHDRYYTLADFDSYIEAQDKVNATYKVQKKVFYLLFSDLFQGKKYSKYFFFINLQNWEQWAKMAVLNVASSGKFSSDRTIAEYGREIWGVEPSFETLPDPSVSQTNGGQR